MHLVDVDFTPRMRDRVSFELAQFRNRPKAVEVVKLEGSSEKTSRSPGRAAHARGTPRFVERPWTGSRRRRGYDVTETTGSRRRRGYDATGRGAAAGATTRTFRPGRSRDDAAGATRNPTHPLLLPIKKKTAP